MNPEFCIGHGASWVVASIAKMPLLHVGNDDASHSEVATTPKAMVELSRLERLCSLDVDGSEGGLMSVIVTVGSAALVSPVETVDIAYWGFW